MGGYWMGWARVFLLVAEVVVVRHITPLLAEIRQNRLGWIFSTNCVR